MQSESPSILQSFTLTSAQREAALNRGSDVVVTAGAGTGKTRTLVARYLALLADGVPLRQIVAVTFTRKAAREMRNRVRQEIGRYLSRSGPDAEDRQKWHAYYNELDAARIGTIHNLCGEILRAHPAAAGIDPRFTVLDETQSALLVQDTVAAALAWAVENEQLVHLFTFLGEQGLQELAGILLANRLTLQDVMERIPAETVLAHWQQQLTEIQAETVANLLADPGFMRAQRTLAQNEAGNPNDKAERQRRMVLRALDGLAGESLAGKLRNLAILDEINLSGGSQAKWPGGKEQLQEVKESLRTLRTLYRERPLLSQSMNAQDEAIAAAMPAIYTLAQYALRAYQAGKADRDALDFDDLEAMAIQLLQTDADVRAYWQRQIQALLVDEFQDTNAHQRRLLRLLCPEPGKLFIVGDAKQSIYRFRGADVTVFAAEKGRIKAENGALLDLDTSYRAHASLLAAMNRLLHPVLGDEGPQRLPWAAPFVPLEPGTKEVRREIAPPFVEFHVTAGNKQDALPRAAAALADRLVQLHHEHQLDYGEMAILCRASGAFQYYEDALDWAGIPYLTVAGKGFYERPEIRDLLNALRAIADPHDDLALVGLLRSPACALSDVTLYRLAAQRSGAGSLWDLVQGEVRLEDDAETLRLQTAVSLLRNLHRQAGRTAAADVCKQFLDRTHYRAILRRAGQPRALRNVAKLLADIHSSEMVGITEFLEYTQTLSDSGSRHGEARATGGGSVQIMSIHAAKGLEFPVVILGDAGSDSHHTDSFLVDGDLGVLLSIKSEEGEQAAGYQLGAAQARAQDEAEKARMLYVALTRAEQLLFISGTIRQYKSGLSWKKGWLGQLADITGVANADWSRYDEEGDGRHTVDAALRETAVRAVLYEPNYPTATDLRAPASVKVDVERPFLPPLQVPVGSVAQRPQAEEEEAPARVWQVVPAAQRPTAPAWVVGSIVHEALALWRWPGPGFDAWVTAQAREHGLTDPQPLRQARTDAARLLRRLQQHPIFREIETAEQRWHELPYSYEQDGMVETGYIDLLYRHGQDWTLVDFKTDRVANRAVLLQLLREKDYVRQVQRYETAVQQLLGVTPRLKLCFLNVAHQIYVVSDLPAGA